MRTLFVLLLLLVCIFPSQRSEAAELQGCRTQFSQPDLQLSLTQQIQLDLLSGVWVEEHKKDGNTTAQRTLLRFIDTSKAQLMHYQTHTGPIFTSFYWEIAIDNGAPLLLLTDAKKPQQKAWRLEQTCDGIELTNQAAEKTLNLTHKPLLSPAKLTSTRKELIGSWKNTYYPTEAITANATDTHETVAGPTFLNYEFDLNGNYTKSIKGNDTNLQEQGEWELTGDGNTIIFYSKGGCTYSAHIQHLQMDELVLEQSLSAKPLNLCIGIKSFYFNKQY